MYIDLLSKFYRDKEFNFLETKIVTYVRKTLKLTLDVLILIVNTKKIPNN